MLELGPDGTVFRQRLRAVLGPREAAAAGCVQFVGLDGLKEKLGPRWGAAQSRVHALVERLLRQTLASEDVYYAYGSETYVVVFARLNATQASLVCAKIMQELQRLLLGEPDLGSIIVRTAAREASGALVLKPERLADLLGKMAAQARPVPALSGADQAPAGVVAMPVQTSMAQITIAQAATARAAAALAEVGRSLTVNANDAAAGLIAGASADGLRDGCDPWAHLRPVIGPPEVAYRPVWDVRSQALGLYVASPRRSRVGGRQYVYGYEAMACGVGGSGTAAEMQEILDLDRQTLRDAVDAYLELYDNRFRYYLALPVHFETLAGGTRRRAYLELASHIPAHLLPFITYHLMGVPDGVPVGRLTEFVSALRPLGRAVLVCADLSPHPFATFATAGVKGVVLSLSAPVSRARLIQDLHLAAAEARRRNLLILVEGVDTPDREKIAEEAGCAFMAGDLIGPWVDFPGHATRRSRADILDNGMLLDR
ncbi:hypothetical protein [Nitrospirillum iridis]|uniref:GGDEF domain-containing protein n=1 Tax=Nitrospirillum iridis TaxID=765888 RepID=A0A7X0AY36_9PROT|nr:hypothetical protein [Nitrospirillum iridis]MBB6250734.1 GGDEF domain-containing protein [Nitrospirillum iridis]